MKTEKKPEVIAAFQDGGSFRSVAVLVGIAPVTIWRWMQTDPEFEAAVRDACSDPDDEVEAVTFNNCIDPDPSHNVLRMFWLKSRRPERYGERLKIEHGGEIQVSWGDPQGHDAAPASRPGIGADEPGAIQGSGVREAMGEDQAGSGPLL